MLFKTLFQHYYAYRNTLIWVNRMQFNLSYTIGTKNLVPPYSWKGKYLSCLVTDIDGLKKKKVLGKVMYFLSHIPPSVFTVQKGHLSTELGFHASK